MARQEGHRATLARLRMREPRERLDNRPLSATEMTAADAHAHRRQVRFPVLHGVGLHFCSYPSGVAGDVAAAATPNAPFRLNPDQKHRCAEPFLHEPAH